MDWGFTIAVVITGIVVVFVVLTILVMLCTGMGAFFSTETPKVQEQTAQEQPPTPKAQEQTAQEQPAPAQEQPAPAQEQVAPVVEEGISNEVVAAISASIAMIMSDEEASYQITSVKKASQAVVTDKRATRTAWSSAGFAQNTRPF